MLQKVQKYMEELNMVSPKDMILVGVSGGADSVGLLLSLSALSKDLDITLEVVHVEHGIRGEESLKDAEFVADLCERMQLPCHKISVDVPAYSKRTGMGLEEAARLLRYEAFSKLAKEKNAKVALAHHMQDNAETILFQMARGSSLAGLCGIQPVRQDENGVTYIRPFLTLHRDEIENFLKSHGMGFCTDSTNQELDYSRNYLRQVVLPALTKVNTQAIGHMNEAASKLSEMKEFLDQETKKNWSECVEKTEKGLCVDIDKLSCLHPVVQKEILYRGLGEAAGSKKDISAVHVKGLQELCENQSGKELHLPYQIRAKKEYDKLWLFCGEEDNRSACEKASYDVSKEALHACLERGEVLGVPLGEHGEEITIRVFELEEKNIQIPQNPYTKWMDYDKIKQGFCIRTRQSGDYFISDVFGHHKKLKQYFIDEKIPANQRESMWLLAQDDCVLWLIGGRISEHVKIAEDTKYIIEITYKGDMKNEC